MMSKAHIAVGAAVGLAFAQAGSVESCIAAVMGGCAGGIVADCDITPSRAHKDALIGRLIVVGLTLACLAIDRYVSAGLCDYLLEHIGMRLVVGVGLLVALVAIGAHTNHRSFTHSLVAMAAFCAAAWLICEPVMPYFALGYASHLVLDVTNKQGIRLIWPAKAKVSLGLCSAKGVANTAAMVLGIAATALLLVYRLGPLAGIGIAFV